MAAQEADLRLATIARLTFAGLLRRPFDTFFIGFFFVYLPTLLVALLLPKPVAEAISVEMGVWWLQTMAIGLPSYIFYGWIAFIIAGEPTPKLPLMETFKRFIPLIALGALVTVGAMLGFLLLFAPGVAWCMAMMAATPSLAVERRSVLAAANRSIELTQNRLWSILGCLLGVYAPFLAAAIVLELMPDSDVITIGILPAFDALVVMVGAAFAAAIYRETRRLGPKRAAPRWAAG